MKHQQEILGQRIENMKNAASKTVSYLGRIEEMLNQDKLNIKAISAEVDEIKDFLMWMQNQ